MKNKSYEYKGSFKAYSDNGQIVILLADADNEIRINKATAEQLFRMLMVMSSTWGLASMVTPAFTIEQGTFLDDRGIRIVASEHDVNTMISLKAARALASALFELQKEIV